MCPAKMKTTTIFQRASMPMKKLGNQKSPFLAHIVRLSITECGQHFIQSVFFLPYETESSFVRKQPFLIIFCIDAPNLSSQFSHLIVHSFFAMATIDSLSFSLSFSPIIILITRMGSAKREPLYINKQTADNPRL